MNRKVSQFSNYRNTSPKLTAANIPDEYYRFVAARDSKKFKPVIVAEPRERIKLFKTKSPIQFSSYRCEADRNRAIASLASNGYNYFKPCRKHKQLFVLEYRRIEGIIDIDEILWNIAGAALIILIITLTTFHAWAR